MNGEVIAIQKNPLVYLRRRMENGTNPNSLPPSQSPSLEKGTIPKPSAPSNYFIKSNLDVPLSLGKALCSKYPLVYFCLKTSS